MIIITVKYDYPPFLYRWFTLNLLIEFPDSLWFFAQQKSALFNPKIQDHAIENRPQ